MWVSCSQGWPQTCIVAEGGFEQLILLLLYPRSQSHNPGAPHLTGELLLHLFIFETRSHYVVLAGLEPGWPQTHRDLPASAIQVPRLKVCTTMSGLLGETFLPSVSPELQVFPSPAWEVPGNSQLGPAGAVSAVAHAHKSQGLEKTVFYVCYTGYPVQPHEEEDLDL